VVQGIPVVDEKKDVRVAKDPQRRLEWILSIRMNTVIMLKPDTFYPLSNVFREEYITFGKHKSRQHK
jgi:hypothetical protein